MSGYTWQLIEWFKNNRGKSKTKLAINSNLGLASDKIDEFVNIIHTLPHVEIYTSCESVGLQAEYIRDGLDYKQWLENVRFLIEANSVKALHVMCTINALCLDSLPQFLDQLVELKEENGKDFPNFTLNILRFPSFQSPLVLPAEHKDRYRQNLLTWLDKNKDNKVLHQHEIQHLQRLIDYLDVVKTPHSETFDQASLHNDFKKFYIQYDRRRGKDFVKAFPALADWYSTL
jgi:hypothetical protein